MVSSVYTIVHDCVIQNPLINIAFCNISLEKHTSIYNISTGSYMYDIAAVRNSLPAMSDKRYQEEHTISVYGHVSICTTHCFTMITEWCHVFVAIGLTQ